MENCSIDPVVNSFESMMRAFNGHDPRHTLLEVGQQLFVAGDIARIIDSNEFTTGSMEQFSIQLDDL